MPSNLASNRRRSRANALTPRRVAWTQHPPKDLRAGSPTHHQPLAPATGIWKILQIRLGGPTQSPVCRPFRPSFPSTSHSGGSRHRHWMCRSAGPETHGLLHRTIGYLTCRKAFVGKRPKSTYMITVKGKRALANYLDEMQRLINAIGESR